MSCCWGFLGSYIVNAFAAHCADFKTNHLYTSGPFSFEHFGATGTFSHLFRVQLTRLHAFATGS